MAKGNIVKWITIKGRRVPIYEDGSMGGFMEGKQHQEKSEGRKTYKEHAKEHDEKKERNIFGQEVDFEEYEKNAEANKKDWVIDTPITEKEAERIVEEGKKQGIADENDAYDREHKEGKYADDKIKSNIGVSHKSNSHDNEVLRIRDELDSGKSTTTSNKEIADMYKNSPKKAFDVKDNGDGTYEISKKGSNTSRNESWISAYNKAQEDTQKASRSVTSALKKSGYTKDDAIEAYAKLNFTNKQTARENIRLMDPDKVVSMVDKYKESKSIKVGNKEVAVNKTSSTYWDREVKRLVGDKYGEAWAARRIDSYSSSKLKQIAKDAGIKNISTMTDNELRKKLLAMWKRG